VNLGAKKHFSTIEHKNITESQLNDFGEEILLIRSLLTKSIDASIVDSMSDEKCLRMFKLLNH